MTEDLTTTLKQAVDLLKGGQTQEAREILTAFLKSQPNSDQGWFLLSFTVVDPKQQIYCLQRALKLNPNNAHARNRFSKIQGSLSRPQPPKQVPKPEPKPEPASSDVVAQKPVQARTPIERKPRDTTPRRPTAQTLPVSDKAPTAEERLRSLSRPREQEEAAESAAPIIQPTDGRPEVPVLEQISEPERIADALEGEEKEPPRRRSKWFVLLMSVIILIVVSGIGFGGYYLIGILRDQSPDDGPIAVGDETDVAIETTVTVDYIPRPPTPTTSIRALPPTWTPTATTEPTQTPAPTDTQVPTPTNTRIPLGATAQARMFDIQEEVAQLRNLRILADDAPAFLVTHTEVEDMFMLTIDDEYIAGLENQAIIWRAIGWMDDEFDLVTYALNTMADSVGGFFRPETKEIFIIGYRFAGAEHYVYAHEFDHALVDQHFDFMQLGLFPTCEYDSQKCDAILALIEGDATLLMNQWLETYATMQDLIDILSYVPPFQFPQDQEIPPFVIPSLSFPYAHGYDFVSFLYSQGGWQRVNQAYGSLPESSEHILHPEKYLNDEPPIVIEPADLRGVLDDNWELLTQDVLGEFNTYLILGFSAYPYVDISDVTATNAASGWGGDIYQVYYNAQDEETLMAIHWVWDTADEADEFLEAIEAYLNQRYASQVMEDVGGKDCWQGDENISCLVTGIRETLWMLGPNMELIDEVFNEYVQFQ